MTKQSEKDLEKAILMIAFLRDELRVTRESLERWKRGRMLDQDYIAADGSVVGDPFRRCTMYRKTITRLQAEIGGRKCDC